MTTEKKQINITAEELKLFDAVNIKNSDDLNKGIFINTDHNLLTVTDGNYLITLPLRDELKEFALANDIDFITANKKITKKTKETGDTFVDTDLLGQYQGVMFEVIIRLVNYEKEFGSEYPNVIKVLPKEEERKEDFVIALDADKLLKLANSTNYTGSIVKISCKDKIASIIVEPSTHSKAKAILMPCRIDN